jgi:hypothetical protein
MTVEAKFPVFVFEGNDLSLFADFDSLTIDLEGVDVEGGVYVAYDASGREVALRATGVSRGRFGVEIGRVLVGEVSAVPSCEQFERRLRSYLQACGRSPRADAALSELVQACVEAAGF